MTQDELILLLFKIILIIDITSIAVFIGVYTRYAKWWKDQVGRTLVVKDILLLLAFTPSTLSLFFRLSRYSSRAIAWVDIGLFTLIAAVMWWRIAVWVKIHREAETQKQKSRFAEEKTEDDL